MLPFSQITAERPSAESVASRYTELEAQLVRADSEAAFFAFLHDWDRYRRELRTWESLVDLHFNQDTRNEDYKKDREYSDELRPKICGGEVQLKRMLLDGPWREAIQNKFGPQVIALWEADRKTFQPVVETQIVEEAKLQSEYTSLTSSARFPFRGEELTLPEILKLTEDPDRATRYEAEKVRWTWFAQNREALDRIYDDEVRVRTEMARKLGFPNFTGLGYARLSRVDYTQEDVEKFRAAIREEVVPLCAELRKRQAARLGIDRLMFWDEAVHDPQGNPAPKNDHDWLIARAQEMFDSVGGGLETFFQGLIANDLTDMRAREGKAPGGFCTSFPTVGLPYIFGSFNGTKMDIVLLTHEIGHAFQCYMSREQPISDYVWPTTDACEIHSMSLEFLTWPEMERFFGKDADRFRRIHLEQSLLFLPYGAAVDHFQHFVYANPDATPAERNQKWRDLEKIYLPWRDYGDLPHVTEGGQWQRQLHIYLYPFYYLDYALAQTCALQFWVRSQKNYREAVADYVKLCRRGGEAPFQELARSAGLVSPFDPHCLRDVVQLAHNQLS